MVNTFLPYPSIRKSIKCLDNKRLLSQRNEAYGILRVLRQVKWKKYDLSSGIPSHVIIDTFLLRIKQVLKLGRKVKRETGKKLGWCDHTATLMWVGYDNYLAKYYNACIDEWCSRKGKNGKNFVNNLPRAEITGRCIKPWWFGHEPLHDAYKVMLIKKKEDHYLPKFGEVKTDMTYYLWPTHLTREEMIKIVTLKN